MGTKTGENLQERFLGQKLLVPIVEIVFPQSSFLFYCGIHNNAVGDNITFAFALTHHQNLTHEQLVL